MEAKRAKERDPKWINTAGQTISSQLLSSSAHFIYFHWPTSSSQPIYCHQDKFFKDNSAILPAHCLNIFVPLVDVEVMITYFKNQLFSNPRQKPDVFRAAMAGQSFAWAVISTQSSWLKISCGRQVSLCATF